MNSPYEPTLAVVRSLSDSDIILSDTKSGYIDTMIQESISADVWAKIETTATSNGYTIKDCVNARDRVIPDIMGVVNSFWDHIENYERQGYKVVAYKLQIQFKSAIAQTEINYDILTTATQRKIRIINKIMTDIEPFLEEKTNNYTIEEIPLIIDNVRTGEISEDFSAGLLEEELERNPNWKGENLAEMSTFKSTLHLFQLKIKPTLFFESVRPVRIEDSNALLSGNETDLTISQTHTDIQQATPSSRCSVSGESGTIMSFFRRGIHLKYKSNQPNPPDIQSGLLDLSID